MGVCLAGRDLPGCPERGVITVTDSNLKRLTEEELDAAREAGAAPEFLAVAAFAPNDAGAERNSAAVEVQKRLDVAPEVGPGYIEGLPKVAGDYSGSLWDGNLGKAFIHADINNIRILASVFSVRYLIERVIADEDMETDYATRLVSERIEEHAVGGTGVSANAGP